jgi:hypothetical protein
MDGEIEFAVAEATSEDGRGWYWRLTMAEHDCLIGPFTTEKDATKDALETITGGAVVARNGTASAGSCDPRDGPRR